MNSLPEKEEPVKEKMPKTSEHSLHRLHASWRNPWVILATVLVAAFILFSVGSAHLTKTFAVRTGFGSGKPGMMTRGFSRRDGGGLYNSNSSGTRIEGVVTAANGNTLTVAGDGTTHSVVTSSSTTYTNGSSAAVDDTVVAIGSTSGGSFTATNVIVNP